MTETPTAVPAYVLAQLEKQKVVALEAINTMFGHATSLVEAGYGEAALESLREMRGVLEAYANLVEQIATFLALDQATDDEPHSVH